MQKTKPSFKAILQRRKQTASDYLKTHNLTLAQVAEQFDVEESLVAELSSPPVIVELPAAPIVEEKVEVVKEEDPISDALSQYTSKKKKKAKKEDLTEEEKDATNSESPSE